MPLYDPDASTAREDLCRFLSACFYEPTPVFAEENLFGNMQVAASRVHPDLAEQVRRLGEAFAAQDLQALLVDYTRLFLGPIEALAPPYGSSWLDAPTPTGDHPAPVILDLYSEGGLEIDPEFMELPDHVAVELEFLYLLLFTENQADSIGNADARTAAQALRQRFLTEHLGVWIGPFATALATAAQTTFYRELALLTERFVRMNQDAPMHH